jgi:uncharacterized protein YdeI (YjbR/CyaY-like superfamily)
VEIKNIIYFRNVKEFRKWLKRNHKTGKELWAGFYKKSSGKEGITYPEAVDTALCFGWIDGIRKSVDQISYANRFTPRKFNSNWSAVNIRKVEELKKQGLMEPAGLAVYEKRRADKSEVYSFEQDAVQLDDKSKKLFRKNKKAWNYFESETPSYRKISTHWVNSAKRDDTRIKRLQILISSSENQERIPLLKRNAG